MTTKLEQLAFEIAVLSKEDLAKLAHKLFDSYPYTASNLSRLVTFEEMDVDYGAYNTFEEFQRRENILT